MFRRLECNKRYVLLSFGNKNYYYCYTIRLGTVRRGTVRYYRFNNKISATPFYGAVKEFVSNFQDFQQLPKIGNEMKEFPAIKEAYEL